LALSNKEWSAVLSPRDQGRRFRIAHPLRKGTKMLSDDELADALEAKGSSQLFHDTEEGELMRQAAQRLRSRDGGVGLRAFKVLVGEGWGIEAGDEIVVDPRLTEEEAKRLVAIAGSPTEGNVEGVCAWLEKQARESSTGISFDHEPDGFRFLRFHHAGKPHKTILQAIEQEGFASLCTDVAELPDRTSPDDWPEAMLVTSEELRAIVLSRLRSHKDVPAPTPAREARAYMRRWAFDKNEGTKGNRPKGWNYLAVTAERLFDDDVPLFDLTPTPPTAAQPEEGAR
jgi:hypothetical protein